MSKCNLCPRRCGADRSAGELGICGVDSRIFVARAALHIWEEPCISGESGSGTVFFCGCPLHCVYCQNQEIASTDVKRAVSGERLKEIFLELQEKGAANINLVTPSHYTKELLPVIREAKSEGMKLPIVYNCSGYERVESLRMLAGLVDIYLTDFKYWNSETAERYSCAPDYPEAAKVALMEMVNQTGSPVFSETGMMEKGVIVRHLLLPGHVNEAKQVVEYLYETYKDQIYISLMNQYTPFRRIKDSFPELSRRVTKREYNALVGFALDLGVTQAFIQEGETAEESFIPAFDYEGI